jgi:outer membrane immunogenic protein
MRRLGLTLLASFALIGSAAAADLPVKAPIAPVWIWDGFYVGANVGYSWGRASGTDVTAPFPGFPSSPDGNFNGWLGGLQAGRNWQSGNWVFGIEGDIQITGEKGSSTNSGSTARLVEAGSDFNDIFTQTLSGDRKLPWFATLRGRIGGLIDPTTLLYGTGGLAVGHFTTSGQSTITCQRFGPGSTGTIPQLSACIPPAGSPTIGSTSFSDSTTKVGWTLGAGVEKHVTRNWSVKLEYLYLDYGKHTFFGSTAGATEVRLRDHVARVGINYLFN